MEKVAYIYDNIFLEHDPGEVHPERSQRLESINTKLQDDGIWEKLDHLTPAAAKRDLLTLAHAEELVDYNLAQRDKDNVVLDNGDTRLSTASIAAAQKAVGAGVLAVKLLFQDQSHSKVFAAVRPPGHHAEFYGSMGFCIFNNIAVAAAYAIQQKYIQNALIIDWDVHHGNGTQDIFYERSDVFYLSFHQSPLFPGTGFENETGKNEGLGFTMNRPLSAGKNDKEYIALLYESLSIVEKTFEPDVIFISAGFDAHKNDPIGGMNMTAEGFASMTKVLSDFAAKHCDGKIIAMLEGGYHLGGLSESVAEHLKILIN